VPRRATGARTSASRKKMRETCIEASRQGNRRTERKQRCIEYARGHIGTKCGARPPVLFSAFEVILVRGGQSGRWDCGVERVPLPSTIVHVEGQRRVEATPCLPFMSMILISKEQLLPRGKSSFGQDSMRNYIPKHISSHVSPMPQLPKQIAQGTARLSSALRLGSRSARSRSRSPP
jgi:hypothetical protein